MERATATPCWHVNKPSERCPELTDQDRSANAGRSVGDLRFSDVPFSLCVTVCSCCRLLCSVYCQKESLNRGGEGQVRTCRISSWIMTWFNISKVDRETFERRLQWQAAEFFSKERQTENTKAVWGGRRARKGHKTVAHYEALSCSFLHVIFDQIVTWKSAYNSVIPTTKQERQLRDKKKDGEIILSRFLCCSFL